MSQVGLIGLAVMGQNLARNIARKHTISVYNRSYSKTQELLEFGDSKIQGFEDLQDFVASLERPRKVMIMVKAGKPVDLVIDSLLPFLEAGDVVVDLGNSHWQDTIRREKDLSAKELKFVGCGVSGGAKGALEGPSIMPGGEKQAVESLLPFLQSIAAKDFGDGKCTTNIGLSAAGHFVKMVHNGIEYGMMQVIAEIYDYLKSQGLTNPEILNIFKALNTGQNQSFLLEISIAILESKDSSTGQDLLDLVVDRAKAKGTGRWTVEAALELGVAVPSIAGALFARILSARTQAFQTSKYSQLDLLETRENTLSEDDLQDLLRIGFESCYLQGLDLIQRANQEFAWNIKLPEVVRIWQGGCIIRSRLLQGLYERFVQKNNLALDIRNLSNYLAQITTPKPVLNSVLDYSLSISRNQLPTNLIQAQRDYFGQHTYKRFDQDGDFTGGWRV